MKGEKMLLSAWNLRWGTSVMLRLLVAAAFAIAATAAGASPANAVGGSPAGADDERLIRLAPHNITLPKLGKSRTYTVTVTNISGKTLPINTIEMYGHNFRVDWNYG